MAALHNLHYYDILMNIAYIHAAPTNYCTNLKKIESEVVTLSGRDIMLSPKSGECNIYQHIQLFQQFLMMV